MRGKTLRLKWTKSSETGRMWGKKYSRGRQQRLHKEKKQAEPVVTSLEKPKHTQVNYYPYKSLTTACSHTTT